MSDHINGHHGLDQTERQPDRVDSQLKNAFSEELAAAKADVASAPWLDGLPRPASRRRSGRVHWASGVHPGHRTGLLQAAALAIVVALVSAGILIPGLLRPASAPLSLSTSGAAPPSATGIVSPSASPDPLLYGDGIPRVWQGQPVLRGQAAIDAANASTDTKPFLVAFWAGIEQPRNCLANPPGNLFFGCGAMLNVGDQPGIVSTELGQALRVDTSHYAPAPVIVRVHTHDPAGMDCTLDYVTACEHVMVDEAYLWSGDEATASHPTSAAQAAAAFGVSAITTTSPPCEGSGFPGIPVLALPGSLPANSATSPIDPIWATGQGVIAIFPSAQALAAAAPDAAAHGESDIPPIDPNLSFISSSSHFVCDDIINGVSYKTHWLARGNVLLAVEYDSNLGVAADPFVKEARQKLQTLPAS